MKLYEVPVDDQYMLSRVDFGKGFFDKALRPRTKQPKGARGSSRARWRPLLGLSKALGLEKFTYNPIGFMQMMFLDPTGFDQKHYVFSYVRQEFLGSVRTWVFDVHPKVKGHGPLLRAHLDRGPGRQRRALQRHLHRAERGRLVASTTSTSTAGG